MLKGKGKVIWGYQGNFPLMELISGFILLMSLGCNGLKKEEYLRLNEVIPEAKIISETEGIVEYQGDLYILGLNDLKKKRELISKLDLLNLEGSFEIDLRYRRQVIIRKRKG